MKKPEKKRSRSQKILDTTNFQPREAAARWPGRPCGPLPGSPTCHRLYRQQPVGRPAELGHWPPTRPPRGLQSSGPGTHVVWPLEGWTRRCMRPFLPHRSPSTRPPLLAAELRFPPGRPSCNRAEPLGSQGSEERVHTQEGRPGARVGWDVETVPVTSGGHGGGHVPDALVRSSHEKLDLGQTGGPSTALGKRKQGERAQPCGCVAASRCWPRIRGLQRPREENPRTEHTLPEAQGAPCERRVSRHRGAGPSWGERSRLGRRAEPHCVQRGTRAGGGEAGCQGRDHQACTQAHGGAQHRKPASLGRDHLCLWEGHTADSVDGGTPHRTRSPALVDGAQGACSPSTAGISNQRTCGHNTVVPRRDRASKAPRPQAARVWGPPPPLEESGRLATSGGDAAEVRTEGGSRRHRAERLQGARISARAASVGNR